MIPKKTLPVILTPRIAGTIPCKTSSVQSTAAAR